MHRYRQHFVIGLAIWAYSCALVIGDIPEAADDTSGVAGQGGRPASASGGTSGPGGAGAGGQAGAPSAGDGGTDTTNASSTEGGGSDHGGESGFGGTASGGMAGAGGAAGEPAYGGATMTAAGGSNGGLGGVGGNAGGATLTNTGGIGGTGGSGAVNSGGGGGCDPCDCDDDGALAESCDGEDCDDDNAQVFPGQTLFFAESSGSVGFDYNCDERSEREFDAAVVCEGLALLGCADEEEGFLDTLPACGASAAWGGCRVDGLACVNDEIDTRVLRCR